jgi:S-adenosylmethionine hydrolase
MAGALLLRSAVEYFPAATIHVAVVDPGVGTGRRGLAVETERGWLVGPDNGLLMPAAGRMRVRSVRRLDCEELFLDPVSRTFHGRDVFAPVAAHLAIGVAPQRLGDVIDDAATLVLPEPARCATAGGGRVEGEVVYVDGFGNLVTNVPRGLVDEPARAWVSCGRQKDIRLADSYAAVSAGQPVAVFGSWGNLEVAVRDGSAAQHLGADVGWPVSIEWGAT